MSDININGIVGILIGLAIGTSYVCAVMLFAMGLIYLIG